MFEAISQEIDNYENLSLEEEDQLYQKIIAIAEKNKAEFSSYVSKLDYGYDSQRGIFYEAIWENPDGWENFIYDHLVEVVNKAAKGDAGAMEEMTNVIYFSDLEGLDRSLFRKSLIFLSEKLTSGIPQVRENCMIAMIDIISLGEINPEQIQVSALQELLYDRVFKIRIFTYSNLKEVNLIPRNFSLTFADRFRALMAGYRKMISR